MKSCLSAKYRTREALISKGKQHLSSRSTGSSLFADGMQSSQKVAKLCRLRWGIL